jgi:hypothetical protein
MGAPGFGTGSASWSGQESDGNIDMKQICTNVTANIPVNCQNANPVLLVNLEMQAILWIAFCNSTKVSVGGHKHDHLWDVVFNTF